MKKKENKKALPQAEVKKGYGLDEYFRDTLDSTTFFAELYWVCGKIAPAELTFSKDTFPYVAPMDDTDVYITKIDEDATIRATYWGADTTKDGNLYIQLPQNLGDRIYDIENDQDFEEAQKMFKLGNSNSQYLIEAHKLLNLAVSGADLFLWAESPTTFRLTDLNQDPHFKRELKKKGLI